MTPILLPLNVIGFTFEVEFVDEDSVAIDISSATVRRIALFPPGGTVKVVDAVFVGTGLDGLISYTSVDGDVDEIGEWSIQGYVEMDGGKFPSLTGVFQVDDNLSSNFALSA